MDRINPKQAARKIGRVTIIGALVNCLLGLVKILVGSFFGSVALVADGVHSFSDLVTDGVVIFGAWASAQPPDENHPYGHGKFETFAAAAVALVLVGVGGGVAFNAAVSFYHHEILVPGPLVLLVAGISVGAKEILYRVTRSVARQTNSPSLVANAWHHRSDALSSVAVLIGAAGSMAGWHYGDQVAGIIVGLMVVGVGVSIGIAAINDLAEHCIEEEVLKEIRTCLDDDLDVRGWHHLRTRRIGREIFMDVHVLLDPEISVSEGHKIVTCLEEAIRARLQSPIHFGIDMEPDDEEHRLHRPTVF